MPRDIPLGNGTLLVNFDAQYHIRDIYYPHVGSENHTIGEINHLGIWVDGAFAWLDDERWQRDLRYEPETLVSAVRLVHPELNIAIDCTDCVDFNISVLFRQFTVHNLAAVPREVKLYIHYDWHIEENAAANTVYYDPLLSALIAYRNHRYFLMGGGVGEVWGLHDWATGYKEFNGMQGTWRDAEDGQLGKYPIAQGSVDCTFALHAGIIDPNTTQTLFHWLAAGMKYQQVHELHQTIMERGPASFIERTRQYWNLWVNKEHETLTDVPAAIATEYQRSLLVIATNMDHEGGIIAATDGDIWTFNRDSYAYMWPRDGALVANALSHSGYGESTRGFFDFCRQLLSPKGYLYHKYTPDGALGSSWHPWVNDQGEPQLAIQEDETALVIYSLWQHYHLFRDVEFIKPLYAPLIKSGAEFMVTFRDAHTLLPAASYDLWEERFGIHAYTVATVYAGLMAAAHFAEIFGEHVQQEQYQAAANEIREATKRYLWDAERGCFLRRVTIASDGVITPDTVPDMAMTALYQYGMFEATDPMIESTMKMLLERLSVKTAVGGYARYEQDVYHRTTEDIAQVPGNPWFICSCWAAQYHIARAQSHDELHDVLPLLQWVVDHALPSGILAEQVNPFDDSPLSASPLTWSHAEFVETVRWYVGKHRRLIGESK